MKLKAKLIVAFLAVGLLPFFTMALISFTKAKNALSLQAFSQLESLRDVKKGQLEQYLQTVRDQASTLSKNLMTVAAMEELERAAEAVVAENAVDDEVLASLKDSLKIYYATDFTEAYRAQNGGDDPGVQTILERLDPVTVALQSYYIKDNPHPLGQKEQLDRATDGSGYADLHQKYHPLYRDYLQKFGYYDIFLVSASSGRVVYSVFKELDFATSLSEGPYAGSGIGEAFRRANAATSTDFVTIVDFGLYYPSYNAPAGFVATPIYAGMEKIGVLIFQFPLGRVNDIMAQRAGMGQTGETYLVGSDGLMRSDSYLDPDKHSVVASFRNPATGKVDTAATRAALQNTTGKAIVIDYNGNPVLSAYTPLNFGELRWALLAEIDKAEAFAATDTLQWISVVVAVIGIAGITLLAMLISQRIVLPITGVVQNLTDLAQGEGDLTKRLPVTSKDEIGILSARFNEFMDNLHTMIRDIVGGVATLSSSSTELSVIAEQLAGSAEQTSTRSETVAAAAEEMSVNMSSVSAAMEQSSTNTNMVASAAEEMTSTINEIARSTEKARGVSDRAVNQAKDAGARMKLLGDSAQAIGKVTETITEISEQTNLLALNATIEAARAGEAGKGFAVVANEIKELARQTAEATKGIKKQIDEIQSSTGSTVESIDAIGEVIVGINDVIINIAHAIEEQSVATKEIANNITQASQGISEVNENVAQSSAVAGDITREIGEVNMSAGEIAGSSSQVQSSAEQLSSLAEQLNGMVSRFKV